MRDLLAAKTVDAVVAVNPFIGQIVDAGVGYIAVPLAGEIPSGKPVILYVTTRDWADQHKGEVAGFRASIIEGASFVAAEPDRTKEDINRYAKLPPQVLKVSQLSDQAPKIDLADLGWWSDVMKKQGMLTHDVDVKKLLYP
jgi:NitT/TauT family transport system substrate-binding protein